MMMTFSLQYFKVIKITLVLNISLKYDFLVFGRCFNRAITAMKKNSATTTVSFNAVNRNSSSSPNYEWTVWFTLCRQSLNVDSWLKRLEKGNVSSTKYNGIVIPRLFLLPVVKYIVIHNKNIIITRRIIAKVII